MEKKRRGKYVGKLRARGAISCRRPTSPKSWTEADVTAPLEDRYGQLLRTLYALEDRMQQGELATVDLPPEAKDRWVSFFDDENGRLYREPGPVDRHTLSDRIRLAGWCLRETLRVYETLGLAEECLDSSERFLQRLPEMFSTSDAEEAADAAEGARRTLFKWLKDLQKEGPPTMLRRGQYQKTDATPNQSIVPTSVPETEARSPSWGK
jgi:hypothetical protein